MGSTDAMLSQAEVTIRLESSSWQMSCSAFSIFTPSRDDCSGISFPMLQITTEGWLKSRLIMAVRSSLACSAKNMLEP